MKAFLAAAIHKRAPQILVRGTFPARCGLAPEFWLSV
jgi:hypothetical protein